MQIDFVFDCKVSFQVLMKFDTKFGPFVRTKVNEMKPRAILCSKYPISV
jgi:hypothetical protein